MNTGSDSAKTGLVKCQGQGQELRGARINFAPAASYIAPEGTTNVPFTIDPSVILESGSVSYEEPFEETFTVQLAYHRVLVPGATKQVGWKESLENILIDKGTALFDDPTLWLW